MKERGLFPYPAHSNRNSDVKSVLLNFQDFLEQKKSLILGGRIRSIRSHGNITFCRLEDSSGKIQLVLSKKDLGQELYKNFVQLIDVGDFVEPEGFCFITQKGEQSLLLKNWRPLAKALRPLPDKWAGLKDEEERLRKRYLDFLTNPDLKDLFRKKAIFWQATREFLLAKGFWDVETPVLETSAGGANARPFKTHHQALDMDVFLRISMGELWQKRLLVGGWEKTFEIGRQFRNEGMDAEHLQDYTQMEFYWAYADYNDGMRLVEDLIKTVARKTFATNIYQIKNYSINIDQTWERYDFSETIKKYTGLDINTASTNQIIAKLKELKINYSSQGFNYQRGLDNLWKYCRKFLAGPGFLTGQPAALSPLAKKSASQPGQTERFQVILAGSEVGNGYSELNDPLDQAERFLEQQKLKDAGDEEAQSHDFDFVEALEYGMPPACGFGYSERLFAFLAGKSARECQIFPLVKPK